MIERIAEASPLLKARIAGVLILRILLPSDRLPNCQVDRSASNSGCADGVCRFGLPDFSVAAARKLSAPVRSAARPPRGRAADAVAARDRRERSTMEGAGQRSGVIAAAARHAPLIQSLL